MGWRSDWLYSLLLDRARDTFAEALRAAKERSEERPRRLYAIETSAWNVDHDMTSGDPHRIWSSEDDFSTLIDPATCQSLKEPKRNLGGSIHAIPIFSWFITKDRKRVLICRWIGPLYGNGGWWKVVGQGKRGRLVPGGGGAWVS